MSRTQQEQGNTPPPAYPTRMLERLFWNADERRLRAFWRVMILVVLLVAALLVCMPPATLVLGPALGSSLGALAGITLGVWLTGRYIDRRRFVDYGFLLSASWWADLAFGLTLGLVLMSGIFLVEHRLGWVVIQDTYLSTTEGRGFAPALLGAAAGFIAVGIYEELIFRGYLVQNLAEGFNLHRIGPRRAVLIAWGLTSLLFGLGHALNPNATWISTLNISLAGVFLGLGYVLTRQLALPIGVHITWNFAQGNLYGFPVSGTAPPSAQVLVLEQGGPEAWTGGAFGPEAGLLGLLAVLAGLAATWAWVHRRSPRPAVQLQLAAPPEKGPKPVTAPVPEENERS